MSVVRTSSVSVRNRLSGATLVEVALIFCAAGVLLAVGVPTFLRSVRTSKIAEASMQLNTLYRAVATYYDSGTYFMSAAREKHVRARCLPPSAGPTPARPSSIPIKTEFTAASTPGSETWRALGFDPVEPLYFRYTFISTRSGCGLDNITEDHLIILRAEGDFDDDGELSVFERSARLDRQGVLISDPFLFVRNRTE